MKAMLRAGRRSGFTLVELIVVIAILGVLAAILIPTLIGYTTQSHITSVNNTASDLVKSINYFLTEANTRRYGMFVSTSATTTADISVTNSLWTITVADSTVFLSDSAVSWSGSGTGQTGHPPPSLSNAEDLLAAKLADEFREITTGRIGICLQGGRCTAAYFTANTDQSIHILPFAADGSGWSATSYIWDNSTSGINDEGYYVGTYPVLPITG